MKSLMVIPAFLFVSSVYCQKTYPQNGLYLNFGSGICSEGQNPFSTYENVFVLKNKFTWNSGLGYHAPVGEYLALRFSINYQQTSAERYDVKAVDLGGNTAFNLHTRKVNFFAFQASPVFFIPSGRWQFNFLPTIGISLGKNNYTLSYGVDYVDGYRDSFSQELVSVRSAFFYFSPAISAAYQVTRSRKFKSWLELGLQPSWWIQAGDGDNNAGYSSNFRTLTLQLSYMVSFKK